MQLLAKYDEPVIISDDAHNKERITDHFTEAETMAHNCGIKSFYEPFKNTKAPPLFNENER